jgi:5-methylcytosine-specific restriction protein A
MKITRIPVVHNVICKIQGRSGRWPGIRKEHLKQEPTCRVCGGIDDLEVHHILPFLLAPTLELSESNLITLCNKHSCHLLFGHLGNFKSWNNRVREMSNDMLKKIKGRPQ